MKVEGFVALSNEKISHFFAGFFCEREEKNFSFFRDMFIEFLKEMRKKAVASLSLRGRRAKFRRTWQSSIGKSLYLFAGYLEILRKFILRCFHILKGYKDVRSIHIILSLSICNLLIANKIPPAPFTKGGLI